MVKNGHKPTPAPSNGIVPSPRFRIGNRTITVVISDVARHTHLNIAHVSRIFSGKRTPSLRAAKKISNFLDISLDQLYSILNV